MSDLWDEIKTKVKEVAASWASYVAVGSFILYLFGYLSIRFHLTTLGIGTDLSVVDERYMFAGARFLVYVCACLPLIGLVVLALLAAFLLLRFIYRFLAKKIRLVATTGNKIRGGVTALIQWFSDPRRVATTGIIISVLLIQIVMRKSFLFTDLLLQKDLPVPGLGLEQLLLDEGDARRQLFLCALVAGTILTGGLLYYALSQKATARSAKVATRLLTILVAIQFLFLPVNYGILIMDKHFPRVADLGNQTPLNQGEASWLVWEGSHGSTFLVETTVQNNSGAVEKSRRLVTVPQADIKRTEILGYDQIIRWIFYH